MKQPLLISIGNNCQTKYQTNRFMKNNYKDYKEERLIFDWLMGGGIKGVAKLLESNLFFKKENIVPFNNKNKFLPYCKETNFKFLHDFTGHKWYDSLEECQHHIKECLPSFLEKYNYIATRTLERLLDNSSILVYYGNIELEDYLYFIEVLENKKIKAKLINIYDINTDCKLVLPEKYKDKSIYISYSINNSSHPKIGTKDFWQGNDADWKCALIEATKRISILN